MKPFSATLVGAAVISTALVHANTLPTPTNGKVWVVFTKQAEEYNNNHEVIATWDAVPGATQYRFCMEDSDYLKRCTVVKENKYNIGFQLDYIIYPSLPEIKWTVRAEKAGASTHHSQYATVKLQKEGTKLPAGLKNFCAQEAPRAEHVWWDLNATVKDLAVGEDTEATVSASWRAEDGGDQPFKVPESSGYEICVWTGVDGPTPAQVDCQLYPQTTTSAEITIAVPQNAQASRLEAAFSYACNQDAAVDNSDSFYARQLYSTLRYANYNQCLNHKNNIAVLGSCNSRTVVRFYHSADIDSEATDHQLRVYTKESEAKNAYKCLSRAGGKVTFADCNAKDRMQMFRSDDIMVSIEGSARGYHINCVRAADYKEYEEGNALVVKKKGGNVVLGSCRDTKSNWEFNNNAK